MARLWTNRPKLTDDIVEAALDRALATDGLRCWFQPIVEAHTHRIVAFESLVRLEDADLGILMPAQFLPVAAATGRLPAIDTWMMDRSCARLRVWQLAFPELALQVAVNVSSNLLSRPDLIGQVTRTLHRNGLAPGRLRLELHADSLDQATPGNLDALAELRSLGVAIGLDDIETGSTTLPRLGHLPLSYVTIAGPLVRRAADDVGAHSVVAAITRLAHGHHLTVVAEGIETVEQARAMTDMGCDHLQGFLFSSPTPGAELDLRRRWAPLDQPGEPLLL